LATAFFREHFLSAIAAAIFAIVMSWMSLTVMADAAAAERFRNFSVSGIRITPTTAPIVLIVAGLLAAYSILCFYGFWRHRRAQQVRDGLKAIRLTKGRGGG
jgi:ABC-type antimicrobial peptide transport system permease subunit